MKRALAIVAIVLAFVSAFALTPPRGSRSLRQFAPDRLAALEVRMWQAYYAKERARLFSLLVTMLREQYHYSWAVATMEAFHLARAASTFAELRGQYDLVLPDLEAAYTRAQSWSGGAFDPRAVARAELAWWVARRVPGQNAPEQVGKLIADEYALLYETSAQRVEHAALLRAQAAALRDAEAQTPDWTRIARLLVASYRELKIVLESASV